MVCLTVRFFVLVFGFCSFLHVVGHVMSNFALLITPILSQTELLSLSNWLDTNRSVLK